MPSAAEDRAANQHSLEVLAKHIKAKKMAEELGRNEQPRSGLVARNNAKMKIVRRRPATVKGGLSFCSLGPWGF